MNFLNALLPRLTLTAPTEGSPAAAPAAAPATTAATDPAPAGSLLGDGAPPAPAESEGDGEGAAPAAIPLTREELTLPEGFSDIVLEGEGDAAVTALDRALSIMNNTELSPKDRTQELLNLQTSLTQRAVTEAEAAWTGMQTQWRKEAEALPDIGGAKLPETLAVIKKGLDISGANPAFYEAMTLTGAGNNPHIIRVLHELTKSLSEGQPVLGTPPKGPLPIEAKLYPTMFPQE